MKTMRFITAAAAVSAAFAALPASSGAPADPDAALLEMEARAKAAHETRLQAADANDANRFSRVGVSAVRGDGADGARRVEVEAFTTGIAPGAIVEFAVITLNSGHGYEALFQTAAKAADIRAAFEFAGFPAGLPADASKFRFWPRGERVEALVLPEGGLGAADPASLSDFCVDAKTGAALPGGFVYTGGGGADVDSNGPGSVAAMYNEPLTIIDVPRLAAQGDVYESMVAAPFVDTNAFVPVKIAFSPETRPPQWAERRVRDVALRLGADGFSVDGSAEPAEPVAAAKALCSFRKDKGQDAFVSFSWDGGVTLGEIRNAARLLSALEEKEAETGVRMDAPPEGFPFYKAFLPRDEWRDRSKRFTQPCELRFRDPAVPDDAPDGARTAPATLVRIDEKWQGESLDPEISTVSMPLSGPAELPALLKANSPNGLRVLLVFAPSSLPWSTVAPWLESVRSTHPVVQIFLD